MFKLLKFTCYICLFLLCTGCSLNVKRAPGSVPKPAVKTLGMVKFTIPVSRQGSDWEDQFALWLEDPRTGTHFKTLAVTTYVATEGFKKEPGHLPVWEQHSGIAFMTGAQQKDVNAMLVATPSSGTVTYIWYADNDAGTEAMPAQTYSYYLEGSSKKENHVLYTGTIPSGGKPSHSRGLDESVTGTQPRLVDGVTAEFLPNT